MICSVCEKEKNQNEMIVSRQICKKCDRKRRYEKNKDKESTKAKERYREYVKDPNFVARRKEYDRARKESGERSKYSKERYKDEKVRIQKTLRQKINSCIRMCVDSRNIDIIGCTIEEFKNYIESLFKEGMTWENYGPKGWHIDHIKPYKLFNLLDPEEQKKCCHYTNLQPLWWHENIKKGNKYDEGLGAPTKSGCGTANLTA